MKLILMIRHKVSDYRQWRPHFDAHVASQEAAGLTKPEVYRLADDGSVVLIKWNAADRTRAEAFLSSSDLQDRMKAAGVLGAPDVFFQESP